MSGPLRSRNFRLLFAGRVVDQLGSAVSPPALALAIVVATGSSGALAVVLASAMLPRLALLPVGGVAADRLGPRRVALAADLVSGSTQLFIGMELLSGHLWLTAVAAAAGLGGVATAFDMPASLPLVAGCVDAEDRQAANSLMGVAGSATSLAGPALAGVLIFTAGTGWALVLDAATFWISTATLALLRVRRVEIPRQSLRRDLTAGWAEVRARTWYWTSLVGHGTWNFAAGVLMTLGPLVAIRELGGRGVWLAALEAGALGYLLGSLVAGRTRVSRAILVGNIALMTYAVPLALFAVAASAWLVVGCYGAAMACLGFMNPVWETAVQQQVPEAVLARVSAYDWLASMAAMPLGYALGPILAAAVGFTWPLAGAAALVVAALLVPSFAPSVRSLRLQQPGASDSPEPVPAPAPRSGADNTAAQRA
jgi:Major Facilitator Superfamily